MSKFVRTFDTRNGLVGVRKKKSDIFERSHFFQPHSILMIPGNESPPASMHAEIFRPFCAFFRDGIFFVRRFCMSRDDADARPT